MRHPTRHNKSANYELEGSTQLSHYQISISANEEFKKKVTDEAIKRNVSVSKLMRDSFIYALNKNFS